MEKELFGFSVTEISKSKYKVTGPNCPNDMEVVISKEGNAYRAECNYSLKVKNAASAYQAMYLRSTPEETLQHLLMSLQPGLKSENASAWEKV